jgi:hypothetical protein
VFQFPTKSPALRSDFLFGNSQDPGMEAVLMPVATLEHLGGVVSEKDILALSGSNIVSYLG